MFIVAFARSRGVNGLFDDFTFEYAEKVTCEKVYKTTRENTKLTRIDGELKLVECAPYDRTTIDHYRVKCFQEAGEMTNREPVHLVNHNSNESGRWAHFYIQDSRTGRIFRPSGF